MNRERPWHRRSIELTDKEGAWADLAAFEEWLGSEENRVCTSDEGSDIVNTLKAAGGNEVIWLYRIFCDLADGRYDPKPEPAHA